MADIVESTPAELNLEGDVIKEKSCAEVEEKVTEKGDCPAPDSPVKPTVDTTEEVESTGVKRKSDEAENEDEEAKKVKKTDGEADEDVNGSDKPADNTSDENTDSKEVEEVVKKVIDDEESAAPEVTSS